MPYVSISVNHKPIKADKQTFDLSHLNAFKINIPDKGIDGGDIRIVVKFSTHVYTERATHGRRRDIQDQSGTWRTLCPDRHAVSLILPEVITNFIDQDGKTTVSQDYNKGSNLLLVETVDGESWAVFFCFEPFQAGLLLTVLSVYAKTGNMHRHSKYNNASYYARKCLYSGKRVP